jgi:hypothetical protein
MKHATARRAATTAPQQKKPPARPTQAQPPQRDHYFDAAVPNHLRADRVNDPAIAVELGRTAPRVRLPHSPMIEALFGRSAAYLDRLEVHAGQAARMACKLLGARAFTVGNVIVFAEEDPPLARVVHEVAHAIQQRTIAPSRFAPGSLSITAPGSAPEREAERYASARPVQLSWFPLSLSRDTGDTIDDTQRRLEEMAKTGEWQVKDFGSDSSGARFAVKAGTNDRRLLFRYASPKPWRRGDLQRAAIANGDKKASIEQASKDVENMFKENPNPKDSIAQKGIEISGRTYRISKIDTGATILSLYVFLGDTYTPNAKYYDAVVDQLRGEASDVDPEIKVADYKEILKEVIKKAKSLGKKQDVLDGVQGVIDQIDKALAKDLSAEEWKETLSKIRKDMIDSLIALYPNLDDLHEHLVESGVFGKYVTLQGRLYETWYFKKYKKDYPKAEITAQPMFGDKIDDDTVIKSEELHKLRRGDFAVKMKDEYWIKELKALGGAKDPGPDEQLQMSDYKTIFEKKIKGYFYTKDEKLVGRVFKGVEYEFSDQPRVDTATKWIPFLDTNLGKKWYRTVPNPKASKKVKVKAKAKKSPTLVFTIEDSDKLTDGKLVTEFNASQLDNSDTKLPGLTLTKARIELVAERDPRVKSGDFTMDMTMGGQVTKKDDQKTIEPMPEVAALGKGEAPKTEAKETTPDGLFDITIDKAESTLDRLWSRLEKSVDITDEGLVGKLSLKPGASGIPGFDTTDKTKFTATLSKNKLDLHAGVGIRHKSGKVEGDIAIDWDTKSKKLKIEATATAKKLIPIVDEITIVGTYTKATDSDEAGTWDLKIKKLKASKKLGPVTLDLEATEITFDPDEATVSTENVTLKATMPSLGEIKAENVKIEKNRITQATFKYDSADFQYPKGKKDPALKGKVKGVLTWTQASETEPPKFDGEISGDAAIRSGVIKKLAQGKTDEVKLAVKFGYKEGNFYGSIRTESAIPIGNYFEVSKIEGILDENGELSARFTVRIINLKLSKINLEEAKLSATLDKRGITLDEVAARIKFGDPTTDRVAGVLFFSGKGNEFDIYGNIDVRIKKGLVAHGEFQYDITHDKGSAKLTLKSPDNPTGKIQLLSYKTKEPKTIFELKPKTFIIFTVGIAGAHVEFGFKLAFNYGLDFYVRPSLSISGIRFADMSFNQIMGELLLGGELWASLEATPRAAFGLFLFLPWILKGGGGLSFKVKALARLPLDGTFKVAYRKKNKDDPNSEYETVGNAKLALKMTFGITADLIPDAILEVLGGIYTAKWEPKDPIASFTLLPERELFTYVVNFGDELEEEKNPKLPNESKAPPDTSAKEERTSKPGTETKEANTDKGTAEKPTSQDKAADAKDEEGFSIKKMVDEILKQPKFAKIKEIIELADTIYTILKPIIKYLKFVLGFWIGDAIAAVLDFFKGIVEEKSLAKYLKKWLRKKISDDIYYVIEPLLDFVENQEEKFIKLVSRPLPSSFTGWLEWLWDSVVLVYELSWGGIISFFEALGTLAKRLAGKLGYLINGFVKAGRFNVRRVIRGAPLVDWVDEWVPDEWRVEFAGWDIGTDGWLGGIQVATPLWLLLNNMDNVQYTRGDPYYDFWIFRKIAGAGLINRSAGPAIIHATRTSYGMPLPEDLREKYEHSLGGNLSAVRLHIDQVSGRAAEALGARAYTVGRDIHFGVGQYDPSSRDGELLLAHEVVHASRPIRRADNVEGRRGAVPIRIGSSGELFADRVALAMVEGRPIADLGKPAPAMPAPHFTAANDEREKRRKILGKP